MNDVLALLLSISEDPTVDFTYRLSALKAMAQFNGRDSTDWCEPGTSVDASTKSVKSDQPVCSLPGTHRFSVN